MENENKSWRNRHPVVVSIGVLFLLGIFSNIVLSKNGYRESVSVEPRVESVPESKIPIEEKPVEAPKPIHRDIRVTSQTVKQVDGKYRYFFDIRNHDSVPFLGSVEIKLTTQKGSVLGKNTFDTKRPIEPGLGDSVYFDVNTGPVPYFDQEYAISKFEFKVIQDGEVVATGSGKI